MLVDKVEVCEPIKKLLDFLMEKKFFIIESRVSDYHFHEVYFKLAGQITKDTENLNIDCIKKIDESTFCCSCHWSTVELDDEVI